MLGSEKPDLAHLRKEARELFERFTKTLLMVVSDHEGNKLLLQNSEDTLVFDKKIDGERP
jgi:hypothetical protein